MSKRRTKEEREKIITDYKASGLSMTKWCKANDIAPLIVWLTEQGDERTMVLAYDDLKNIIIAPGITQKKNVPKYGKKIFERFFYACLS